VVQRPRARAGRSGKKVGTYAGEGDKILIPGHQRGAEILDATCLGLARAVDLIFGGVDALLSFRALVR
jgi:hypothetical protein